MDMPKIRMVLEEIKLLLLIIMLPCLALPIWSVNVYGERITENFYKFTGSYFSIYNFFSAIAHFGIFLFLLLMFILVISNMSNIKKGKYDYSSYGPSIGITLFSIFNAVCVFSSSAKYEPGKNVSIPTTLDSGGYVIGMLLVVFGLLFMIDVFFAVSNSTNAKSNNMNSETPDDKNVQEEINVQPMSDADELAKWKKLLDENAITQEEYDKKKDEILNK